MPESRKKLIHDFYTALYQFHLKYADIDNLSPEGEDLWRKYLLEDSENLMHDLKEQGGINKDYRVFLKVLSKQQELFAKESARRAAKRMGRFEYGS